eukprot:8620716-Heterocapsa_arctica.AAC.1
MPPPQRRKPNVVWRLKKSLYGLRRSPQCFNEFFANEMKKLGYERCVSDPQLFYNKKAHALLSAHVDDMMLAAPPMTINKLIKEIDSAMK